MSKREVEKKVEKGAKKDREVMSGEKIWRITCVCV